MDKREQLIRTALRLFSQQGYRGTGIDQIASEAQVTKKTMYRYFPSKDDLILAVLQHYEQHYRAQFMARVSEQSSDPRQRLLAVFDLAYQWFADENFQGCLFINAVAEHGGPRVRQLCQQFKSLERQYLQELAAAAGVADAAGLAEALALLFEGALVSAQVSGTPEAALTAKRCATLLLEQAARAQ